MCGRSRGRKASLKLRNNPWKSRRQQIDFFFLLVNFRQLLHHRTNLKEYYLEQTEPTRAELVLALAVLKREKLDELVDEYWV